MSFTEDSRGFLRRRVCAQAQGLASHRDQRLKPFNPLTDTLMPRLLALLTSRLAAFGLSLLRVGCSSGCYDGRRPCGRRHAQAIRLSA